METERSSAPDVFKALGDPVRWTIVRYMAEQPELAGSVLDDVLAISRPTISYHIRILMQAGLVDVAQPDICHAGGLTELRKIAAMAEASYIKVAPHNPNGPVATIASVHLAASIPNFLILEMAHQPLRDEIQRG